MARGDLWWIGLVVFVLGLVVLTHILRVIAAYKEEMRRRRIDAWYREEFERTQAAREPSRAFDRAHELEEGRGGIEGGGPEREGAADTGADTGAGAESEQRQEAAQVQVEKGGQKGVEDGAGGRTENEGGGESAGDGKHRGEGDGEGRTADADGERAQKEDHDRSKGEVERGNDASDTDQKREVEAEGQTEVIRRPDKVHQR